MGRGQGETQLLRSPPATRARLSVTLFGGPADGWIVEVASLGEPVSVHRTPFGQLVAVADGEDAPPGEHLGIYELVNSPGPERPVFIHRLG